MTRLLFLISLLTLTSPVASEPPPLALHLTPHVGYAPLQVQARLLVEPNYLNRTLCLMWIRKESSDEGAACWEVNGQYAARAHYRTLPAPHYGFPFGTYAIQASLVRSGVPGIVLQVQHIRVLESLPTGTKPKK